MIKSVIYTLTSWKKMKELLLEWGEQQTLVGVGVALLLVMMWS